MPGLLLIAHAPLASALRTVAEHVYPDCAAMLVALDVPADAPAEKVEAQAAALLTQVGTPEVLILTDVFGATPCNVAQRLADGVRVKVVTGVSVPMLWRSLCYVKEPLDSLVARALAGSTQGAMQVSPTRPQNQARNPSDPDAKDLGHDQQ
jgi:mannose PTS system EIIA component